MKLGKNVYLIFCNRKPNKQEKTTFKKLPGALTQQKKLVSESRHQNNQKTASEECRNR